VVLREDDFPETRSTMLMLFLMQAAAPPPAPLPPPQQGVIFAEDYPPEALDNGWQGDAHVDLTIGTNGHAIACKVTQSSGHQVLDDATCRIFMARARFQPAQDQAGNPIESHYQSHLNWRIAH
jgi:protein TonB